MRGSWPLILALWGAGLGAAGQYAKFSVIYDLLSDAYPDGGVVLGWLVSVVGGVGIVLGVVAAMLVARVRYRRALLLSLWLGAAISALQALLPPLPLMLALRAVEGLSHLGLVVAAPTLIAQIATDRQRGLALTLWGTFFGVAFAVMAWAGRPLAISAGLPALFAVHAAYLAGFAIYLAPRLRRLPDEGDVALMSVRSVLATHAAIYRSPAVVAPAAGWFFYTFCFVSILTVLPPYLDPALRGAVMGAIPLVSIAVSMTLGVMLLRIMNAIGVVMLGFGFSALAMVWLYLAPADPLACLALAGAMGLIQGASFAAVPQLNATAMTQARANGAMAQMGNLGNTLGTPVMALALAAYGYLSLPMLAGAAFAMGLVMHLILTRLRRNL
ncbi:MFS transporter [Sulfitobacter sp. HNIBRBA3233]|uniref:MFS transporter n=1 Tax=Sulfitobacter marinivivus TaxID=3158558 RepID=UPI0032DF5A7E